MTTYPDSGLLLAPEPDRRRLSDVTGALLLIVVTAAMVPFLSVGPYLGTVVVGTVATLAVLAAIYLKYRGRVVINAEVAFLLGMTIQYLAAPVLIRVITGNFSGFDGQSAARYAVKDYYVGGMLIVLVFTVAYLLVSALIPYRGSARRTDGRLALAYTHRSLVVMAGLGALLWMIRMALLASGSFYTLNRSRFMEDDPRYSAWSQFNAGIGPAVLAYLWGAMLMKKMPKWLVLAYTAIEFGWNFASGGREGTLVALIVIVLIFIIYRNRLPWRTMLLMALPLFFLVGFMDYYRYALQHTADANSFSLSGITRAVTMARQTSEQSGMQSTLVRGIARLNDLESISAIYEGVPEPQQYLKGETYTKVLSALVPRQLYPDKPPVFTPINEWFFTTEGGSSPLTTMGEGYLNFGWIGVVLAGIASALMVRLVDWFMGRYLWNVAALPVYIGALAIIARMHTQPMAIWITTIIKMGLLVWMVHMMTRPAAPEALGSVEEGEMDGAAVIGEPQVHY